MILIYSVYLLLSALVVFLIFYSRLSKLIKATALTATVLLGVVTQEHYTSHLGKPIKKYPAGEFVYIHHVSVGDAITLWVWTEERGHRLYSFPYNQDTAQKLEEAKEKDEEGTPQEGSFESQDDDEGNPGLFLDDWKGPSTERTK